MLKARYLKDVPIAKLGWFRKALRDKLIIDLEGI
jgi:hypothetical protein